MNNEPTVFVVDADAPTRDAVRDLAYLMNLQCEAYSSGLEFLHAYAPSRPGCLVLEVRIPGINGLEIQQRLAAQAAAIPLVFLTAQPTVSIAVRAMRAGAMHFLEKPFREHELWDTIQEALLLDDRRRSASAERRKLEQSMAGLTSKERLVLGMIAEAKPNKAIASEMGVSLRTVELHRKHLMKKIDLHSSVELVRFALIACDGRSLPLGETLPA